MAAAKRALPEALFQMSAARDRLFLIADELKKRPILKDAVVDIAINLGDSRDELAKGPLEESMELADMERLAREEVAEVARFHVNRLPGRAACRDRLMDVAMLDHKWRVEDYDAQVASLEAPAVREAESPAAGLTLAEIVAERSRLDAEEEKVDDIPGGQEALALLSGIKSVRFELVWKVLGYIEKGEIDPVAAAAALRGTGAMD
jgi:hypothetical protein